MNKFVTCKNPDCPRHPPMTPTEYTTHWSFWCPVCHAVQIWSKDRSDVGGTIGAGHTPGRRSAVGRGFA